MANFEGCSRGTWQTQLFHWEPTAYDPDDLFQAVFDRVVTDPDLTLLGAFQLTGPGDPVNLHQLAAQSVAALLNASHPDVNYPLTVDEVIEEFQAAFDEGTSAAVRAQAERFEAFNLLFCPLPGTPPTQG